MLGEYIGVVVVKGREVRIGRDVQERVERRRPGVFFAGSGTVPGVGVPMVLVSGKLAAARVEAYVGR